ncbi:MAG TPA: hypothetical protein VMU80_27650 [Bryobacteraceae bacterium]|nr:hypothetical protein [Bryobacteraceae bacterium]
MGRAKCLTFLQRLMRAANNIGIGERFEVASLMEQVRTEERLSRFFEEHTTVRQMGSLARAKTVLPGRKGPASGDGA